MVLIVLAAVIGLVLLVGLAFRSLFEEPGARRVRTLLPDSTCTTVLGVLAHPDDEILVAASLAEAASRGCRVFTVTATHGLRGVPDGFAGDTASLDRIRESELRRFGHEIGIREQEIWDFPDGGLSEVSTETLIDSVLSAFRRYEPDLVVTFDSAAGFTGHPDHRRIGEITMLAWRRSCEAAGRRPGFQSPRWIAQVLFPRRVAQLFWMRELRQRLLRQPPADVAVRGNLDIKLLGMSIHQSQGKYFPPPWVRPILYRFYDSEHFALRSCPPARAIRQSDNIDGPHSPTPAHRLVRGSSDPLSARFLLWSAMDREGPIRTVMAAAIESLRRMRALEQSQGRWRR